MKKIVFTLLALLGCMTAEAQTDIDTSLSRHDFFYAGESKTERMFIVKGGEVTWEYVNKEGKGEISDAILMTDGNILVAHQYGIGEVQPDKSYAWHYDAPEGTEIHTIQPIGTDRVLFVQNGSPAKVIVMHIPDCTIEQEFEVPASKSVHGQFRNARLTTRGTLLLAHMGMGYVAEYSVQGRELTRWEIPGPWSVTEVNKDHLQIVGKKGTVKEITRDGSVVWEYKNSEFPMEQAQKAVLLKNGNRIINNWWNDWSEQPIDTLNPPLQAVEVDAEGKVVWMLRSWQSPNLGPSTTIIPLDQAVDRSKLFFGNYNAR